MVHEPISILLAEDQTSVRNIISRFLRKSGYLVIEATDGVEALSLFREKKPHLVITDLEMPELDGIQFLEIAKKEAEHMPFIIVSGAGTMDDVIQGLRLGAWDYLTKPIYPLELLGHSVVRVLERARLFHETLHHQEYLEQTIKQRTAELLQQNRDYEHEIKERRIQQELAQQARNEWERTVDALPDMIAIVDLDHRIVRLNRSMQEKIGKPLDEIVGTTCFKCTQKSPCSHDLVIRECQPRTTEIALSRLDSHYDLTVVPYYSVEGELMGSVHVFRDITERKKSLQEKEALQASLLHAQKLESVGQLASGIAHEINTPTQFVTTNVEFLDEAFADIRTIIADCTQAVQKENLSEDEVLKLLEKAEWDYLENEIPVAIRQSREGLTRVTSIVRAMKEFSHPGSKEAELVDINHVIQVTVTVARNEWKYASEVILQLEPDLPKIFCLPNEIGQVFLNLLVNAAHAITEKLGKSPENMKGTITIRTESDEQWVTIHIADTGCGIPEYAHKKIFDPFYTTKAVGSGTGQGLAIAYDVVTQKHSGTLTFSTRIGEGTTFTIKLPISKNGRK